MLVPILRGFGHGVGFARQPQEEDAERHGDGVERQAAPQKIQTREPLLVGEDPSHDGEDSNQADAHEQVAEDAGNCLHLTTPSASKVELAGRFLIVMPPGR